MPARRLSVALLLAVGLAVAVPGAAGRAQPTRTWRLSFVAPAQFDVTLAALRFPGRGAGPARVGLLPRAAGLYYVAAAVVRRPRHGGVRLLVLSVNRRPRGSLAPDATSIGVRVTAARSLGSPGLRELVDAFAHPAGAAAGVCGLGARHGAGDLRGVLGAGLPLAGFTAAAAVAAAYAVACGLPVDPAFARAVRGCANTLVAGCCPPNALCAVPAPTPTPVPSPPPACPPCPRPPCAGAVLCPLGPLPAQRVLVCPPPAAAAVAC